MDVKCFEMERILQSFPNMKEKAKKNLIDFFNSIKNDLEKDDEGEDCSHIPVIGKLRNKIANFEIKEKRIEDLVKMNNEDNENDSINTVVEDSDLHKAVIANDIEKVKELISGGTDPYVIDKTGKTPYDIAVNNNFTEIELMLECFFPAKSIAC